MDFAAGKRVALACGVAAALGSTVIQGADSGGWYVGTGFGQATWNDLSSAFPGFTVDDSDTFWKIYGGYEYSPRFAVEFGVADLGSATISGGGTSVSSDASTAFVSAVGKIPLTDAFSFHGKIGLHFWDTETPIPGTLLVVSDSGGGVLFGLGAGIQAGPQVRVVLEWERYDDDFDGIDALSAGIVYRFP